MQFKENKRITSKGKANCNLKTTEVELLQVWATCNMKTTKSRFCNMPAIWEAKKAEQGICKEQSVTFIEV